MVETILEILKFTIPGLIVFAAVYFILKQYLNNQYNLQALNMRERQGKETLPLKLAAYERILLFCERISIENLIMRLRTQNMTVKNLQDAMIIAVQKEYEHNMAQQLYTSNKLWDIIKLAKNDVISHISEAGKNLGPQDDSTLLINNLFAQLKTNNRTPSAVAIGAVKEEVKIILQA